MNRWVLTAILGLILVSCVAEEDASDFGVSRSPLRLDVPIFDQTDSRWGNDWLTGGRTCSGHRFRNWGCAVTSMAMVYNYYQSDYTDPGRLNAGGRFSGCNYIWGSMSPPDAGVRYLGRRSSWNRDLVIDYLNRGHPVIARTDPEHFFVITGFIDDRSNFFINDPLGGRRTTLNEAYPRRDLLELRLFEGHAAPAATYATAFNRQDPDGVIEVHPGDTVKNLTVSFRNKGSRPWSNDISSSDYVELRSVDSHGNPAKSWLCHNHWLDGGPTKPGSCIRVISQNARNVNPGDNAWFTFHGVIPASAEPRSGEYKIYFRPYHNAAGFLEGWGGMHFRFRVKTPTCTGECSNGERRSKNCGTCGRQDWECRDCSWAKAGSCREEPNACGGCDTLAGTPGKSCRPCGGVWRCDGKNRVRCEGGHSKNACGGCRTLAHTKGGSCGTCGGHYVCDGVDRLRCAGSSPLNACGECGPAPEEVCDFRDNDCDGRVDEGLHCYYNVRRCFRDFGGGNHDHYFTIHGSCESGWRDEGVKFRTFTSNAGGSLSKLYRRYNPSIHDHMITVNRDEGGSYRADGDVGFCSPRDRGGMVSLWELFSTERRNHFHTTSTSERDTAYNSLDYNDGGRRDLRECFVWPR